MSEKNCGQIMAEITEAWIAQEKKFSKHGNTPKFSNELHLEVLKILQKHSKEAENE